MLKAASEKINRLTSKEQQFELSVETMRKENYRSFFLISIGVKILNKIPQVSPTGS